MSLLSNLESSTADIKYSLEKVAIKLDSLKRHKCSFEGCNSAFNRPWKLERHIYTHTKERPFKCGHPGCNKDYTHNSHLQRHIAVSHAQVKPLPVFINCPYPECPKLFSNKWSLKKHCKTHNEKKVYNCLLCDSNFKKISQLKTHVLEHLGTNLFSCDICKQSFGTIKLLKSHEKKHKIYLCETEGCEEKFDTWNKLRKHMKILHPKMYICDFCGKGYKNRYNFSEHVMSHLPRDARDVLICPYEDCERFYFHKRNLEHHIKSYHKSINSICEFSDCKQELSTRAKLKEHHKLHTEPKKTLKPKNVRSQRKDKGLPQKSKAAMLTGLILPNKIDKSLAQGNYTPEVMEYLENIKSVLSSDCNI